MSKGFRYIVLVCLILVSFTANSQQRTSYTVSGFVVDSLSGEPLAGAIVTYGNSYGAVTNDFGFYSITTTQSDIVLMFRYLGYTTKYYTITGQENVELNVEMTPVVVDIEQIVVTATPDDTFVRTKSLGIVSVNSDQLKYLPSFMGEHDVFKYFQTIPGVSSGREASTGLNLRGGSSDQTLILMDDIPIYNSAHAFGFVSIFSGDYIRSADLYKGYVPPEYGGRLSGIATMNIREGNRKEHHQSIQLGTTTLSALFEGPLKKDKGSYLVAGRYFVPHLFLNLYAAIDKEVGKSYPIIGFYDITAKASYDVGKNSTLYASFYTGQDNVSFIDHYLRPTQETNIEETPVARTKSTLGWGNMVGSLRFSSKVADNGFFNITTYYSHLANRNISEYDDPTDMLYRNSITSHVGEFGIKANLSHNVSRWYDLSYGMNFTLQNFTPQDITTISGEQSNSVVYGSQQLITNNLYLNNVFSFLGFRLNLGGRAALYHTGYENALKFEPRVSLTYYFPKSSIWVSYVQNTQPQFSMNQQIASLPIDYWVPFRSVEELPMSSQFSAGFSHAFNFGLEIQVEGYYKDSKNISVVTNYKDYLLDDGGYALATSESYGGEFLLQYTHKRLSLMLSYTYSRSLYNIDGDIFDFAYDTPHSLNIFGSYKTLVQPGRTHTLSVNIGYKVGMPYYLSNNLYPMEGEFSDILDIILGYPVYPEARLTDFFRLDLNYTIEKSLRKGSRVWQFSILNATAHRNPYVVSYSHLQQQLTAYQLIPFFPSISYIRRF